MTFAVPLEDVVRANRNELLSVHTKWERVRLGDVAEVLNGYPFPSEHFSNETGTPLLRIRDVIRGRTETYFVGKFDPSYFVKPGELVVGMDGDFNCARWRGEPALLNQRVCKLTPNPDFLEPSFLDKVLPGYLSAINAATSSMTVKHLSSRTIADIPLPLPSRNEQRRLAEKLDELLSDLDAGIAALERARANLKRYRAAVLKAAVEGRLTEKWRAAHPKVEPAEKLLGRILAERRKKWEEAHLSKYAEKGQSPPNGWKAKYPEPKKVGETPTLARPRGWGWVTLDQLGVAERPIAYGVLQPGADVDGGVPLVRVGDVSEGRVALESLKRIGGRIAARFPRTKLFGGEVLLTIVGTIGRTAVVPESLAGANTARAVAVIPVQRLLDPRYVEICLRDRGMQAQLTQAAHEVARKTLNLEDVRVAWLPLPPLEEQAEIVGAVEQLLAQSDLSEREVERSISRAARLRQSILKRAFEGRLVPQDPKDEPASELLARVRRARADQGVGTVAG